MLNNIWTVEIGKYYEKIFVRAIKTSFGCRSDDTKSYFSVVAPPNFIQRLCGISFDDKVRKAITKCKKWCEMMNNKDRIVSDIIDKYSNEL